MDKYGENKKFSVNRAVIALYRVKWKHSDFLG